MSVESIASDITEIDELNEHLQLLIKINNMLVTVIDNLQKKLNYALPSQT